MFMNMESHINETLQTTKKRKNVAETAESKKSNTIKCQKLTNYFFVVPKSTNTEAVTAVDAKEKLTDEGDEEVPTESHPSQASKESATSENVQVHPVPVIGDIVPNPPINNEQNKIGCSLNSYKGYLLNINKIQNKVGKEIISVYSEKIGSRKRLLAKCNICSQFEEQAKKRSRNGTVYIAHGVRCDSEEKFKN